MPNGSVLVQTLSLDLADEAGKPVRKRVETRLLVRQQGEWTGYSYRWNTEQSDAMLVPAAGTSAEVDVADPAEPGGRREQVWRFPSRTECMVCHSRASGFLQGFSPLQLDRDHDYGGIVDNQLRTLEHIGVFEGPLPREARESASAGESLRFPGSAGVADQVVPACQLRHLPRRGRGGQLPHGTGPDHPRGEMRLINEVPAHDRFDLPDARLVAPGAPERSVLIHRISRRGTGQMPPLVSTEVDRKALTLFTEWIRSLPRENP